MHARRIEMNQEFINEAIAQADENMQEGFVNGGPFGCVIVKDGVIIAKAHNTVLSSKDPTAHAEVNAIRKACEILGTHDLSGCELYTSAEPCPMCLSAIIWANIKTVYYANTKEDAAKIGFRDDMIYEFIKSNNTDKTILDLTHVEGTDAIRTFDVFGNMKYKKIY